MDKQTFISDLNVRPELIGSTALLSPMPEHCSSQRLLMLNANCSQIMLVDGCETAKIQSGFESKYEKYCINPTRRENDAQILEIIPKFTHLSDENGNVIKSPEVTVIYMDTVTEEVGYFVLPDYIMLHSGFGYYTKKLNQHELLKTNYIPKDMKFMEAPNHDDGLYKLGINANVCYMPLWGTTNDAFIISDRFMNKLRHTSMDQLCIAIDQDHIPLNIYGNEYYKIFPNIGEQVRDDGILLALRDHSSNKLIADITSESLREPSIHDDVYVVPVGSTVIDVQIFTNKSKYADLHNSVVYNQIAKYQDSHNAYYNKVIEFYDECVRNGYKLSKEFSNLVVQCRCRSYANEYKDLKLYNKKEEVKFCYIIITFASKNNVSRGYKLTSRDGAKGVISDVWKQEDMPSYQNGSKRVYADILITGESPFNRLNSSQNYEQFINYASDIIVQRCIDNVIPIHEQYEYVLKFISYVRPVYADYIREQTGMTEDSKNAFMEEVRTNGIYFIIPPFTKTITPEMVLAIHKDFNIDKSDIEYNQYTDTNEEFRVKSKFKGIIGSKYIFLLGKLPLDALSTIETGYVSQFNLPIKPSSKDIKQQSLHGLTPERYGEDETAILTMSIGPKLTCRILGTYSNCLPAQKLLRDHLLTDPYPTRLDKVEMTNDDMIKQAINISIFRHMLAACGYTLQQEGEEGENGTLQI